MNTIKKILIGIGVVLLVISFWFGFLRGAIVGEVILSVENKEYYTTAICDEENFCQDYEIYCDNGSVVGMRSVNGAVFWNDENWTDPRTNEEKEFCK